MADSDLTQAEADDLIAMPKVRTSDDEWDYPGMGGSVSVPLESEDRRESFFLDVSRGRIDLRKGKYQNRGRQVVVLVRLDFGGAPHRNPDGEEVPCPHLHVYREGFGDKWAEVAPEHRFPDTADLERLLEDFLRFCNVIEPPTFKKGLFA